MTGKRKASDDAPGSARPPPPRRQRGDGNDDEHSSLSDYDVGSDRTTLGDDDERSSLSEDYVVDSKGEIVDLFALLNLPQSSDDPAEEKEQQPPPPPPSPPADHREAAEVNDQSVAAAAPAAAPEVVVPAAEFATMCFSCGRKPASVRLVPVEHACMCLPCRSSGLSYCVFCDGPSP